MLNETELFEAVKAFSRRTWVIYKIGLFAGMVAWTILSVAMMVGLSVMLVRWLVTSDLSTEEMVAAIIMPSVMAFMFVAAGFHSANDPRVGRIRNMARAAWGGARAGYGVGLVIVTLMHFLGQLLLIRAMYGPLDYRQVSSYCGLIPVLYGLLFALPIALGTGLFAAAVTVSAQLTYDVITTLTQKRLSS
jgi:hypothetical protein